MNIVLYSTHCSKCDVLEKKLENNGLKYEAIYDFDKKELIKKGFLSSPILVVDGKYMEFSEANRWIENLNK